MPTIVIIDKNTEIKEGNFKNLKICDIYKKCNFRKKDDFDMRYTWNINKDLFISVFSRNDGKSGTENKYDLPPPIDHDLYFGKLLIIATDKNKNAIHLTKELWETIYEKLFGGFEDLATTALEDENEPDELDDYSDSELTETGYLKDGFVVDDNELESEEYISE